MVPSMRCSSAELGRELRPTKQGSRSPSVTSPGRPASIPHPALHHLHKHTPGRHIRKHAADPRGVQYVTLTLALAGRPCQKIRAVKRWRPQAGGVSDVAGRLDLCCKRSCTQLWRPGAPPTCTVACHKGQISKRRGKGIDFGASDGDRRAEHEHLDFRPQNAAPSYCCTKTINIARNFFKKRPNWSIFLYFNVRNFFSPTRNLLLQ